MEQHEFDIEHYILLNNSFYVVRKVKSRTTKHMSPYIYKYVRYAIGAKCFINDKPSLPSDRPIGCHAYLYYGPWEYVKPAGNTEYKSMSCIVISIKDYHPSQCCEVNIGVFLGFFTMATKGTQSMLWKARRTKYMSSGHKFVRYAIGAKCFINGEPSWLGHSDATKIYIMNHDSLCKTNGGHWIHSKSGLNSCCPSEAIWQHRSGSTLVHVMACCLTAPRPSLNHYWLLIISKVQWH